MDLNSIFYSLGLSGMFASRAFLPAFATSLAMKYGDTLPLLKGLEFLNTAGSHPTWFTHDGVVAALGILAALELLAEKSTHIREMMSRSSVYLKSIVAGLTTYGILSAGDAAYIEGLAGPQEAGFLDLFPAFASAGLTYFFGSTRNGFLSLISESDPDGDLGIGRFISWMEEFWASFGVLFLLLYAPVMLILIGLVMGVIHLINKRARKRQDEAKVECRSCQSRIHPFATACYDCEEPHAEPVKLGAFGRLSEETTRDIKEQELRLIELKRSPKSGERLEGRGVDIKGPTDREAVFGNPERNRRYFNRVGERLPVVLGLGALLSLIPVIGLIIGVVYYRLRLVAPFRRYLSFSQSIVTKWLIRILFLILMAFQWVPIAGGAVVPIMAMVNYSFYRSAFKKALKKENLAMAN